MQQELMRPFKLVIQRPYIVINGDPEEYVRYHILAEIESGLSLFYAAAWANVPKAIQLSYRNKFGRQICAGVLE